MDLNLACDEEMLSVTDSPGGRQDQANRNQGAGGGDGMIHVRIGPARMEPLIAGEEPILVNDPRVLQNMLRSEEDYMPAPNYFKMMQTDITPEMRGSVCTWMFEVCEEEQLPESVFLRAINYLDRFLSVHGIQRTHFQLLGAACLLISSKWSGSVLSTERLSFYTAHSVTIPMLLEWEMMILSQFKWDMYAVTPSEFVDPILHRLPKRNVWETHNLRDKIKTYTAYCATDYKFCIHPPSMIASACIAGAIHPIVSQETYDELLGVIHRLTCIETPFEVYPLSKLVMEALAANESGPKSSTNSADPIPSSSKALEPEPKPLTSSPSSVDPRAVTCTSESNPSTSAASAGKAKAIEPSPEELAQSNAKRFDVLKSCIDQLKSRIRDLLRENCLSPGQNPGEVPSPTDGLNSGSTKLGELEQAETPTDVRDVHF